MHLTSTLGAFFLALGLVNGLPVNSEPQTDWYQDSAKGMAGSLESRRDTDWYQDSAQGVADSLDKRGDTDWYQDSAQGVADSLDKRGDTDWYQDSAQGVADSLDKRGDTDWYQDSAQGVANSLKEKRIEKKGEALTFEKRGMDYDEKETYELDLRHWIYGSMRSQPLRESSERGKALFEFEVKPRYDQVDRWHVPDDLQSRYSHARTDAERVSVLNYYLMVTGREPKSAQELGFTPTASEPGLVEENEVGFGYALAGQHQYHCVDFIADAIDIGKENINDFYLKHTIHCLGLLKYLAPSLTAKQPLAYLRTPANDRVKSGYRQTIA